MLNYLIALAAVFAVLALATLPATVAWYRGIETGTQGWARRSK
jgi:hypothetical protein